MMPPLFTVLAASAAVKALLGTPPSMRLFAFAEAEQNAAKPYVTWQMITGVPANYLGQLPDIDDSRVQVDVWANTPVDVIAIATAIRDAVEPHAHMINSGGPTRDTETRCFRYMLEFEFFEPRP